MPKDETAKFLTGSSGSDVAVGADLEYLSCGAYKLRHGRLAVEHVEHVGILRDIGDGVSMVSAFLVSPGLHVHDGVVQLALLHDGFSIRGDGVAEVAADGPDILFGL